MGDLQEKYVCQYNSSINNLDNINLDIKLKNDELIKKLNNNTLIEQKKNKYKEKKEFENIIRIKNNEINGLKTEIIEEINKKEEIKQNLECIILDNSFFS